MAERNTEKRKRSGAKGSKSPKGGARKLRLPASIARVLGRVLPVVALVIALCAAVMLYRRLLPKTAEPPAPTTEVAVQDVEDVPEEEPEPQGVEDLWAESGTFSTGNEVLDGQVKAFCDAYAVAGYQARENANLVYNTIAWSSYQAREGEELPSGIGWDIALAKHYFSSWDLETGAMGVGDVYDFSAAISFCLRYFGYSDALAVPVVYGDESSGQTRGAVVLVTDDDGKKCVCDPGQWGEGWMLDARSFDFKIDDFGQDTTAAEAFGFEVLED